MVKLPDPSITIPDVGQVPVLAGPDSGNDLLRLTFLSPRANLVREATKDQARAHNRELGISILLVQNCSELERFQYALGDPAARLLKKPEISVLVFRDTTGTADVPENPLRLSLLDPRTNPQITQLGDLTLNIVSNSGCVYFYVERSLLWLFKTRSFAEVRLLGRGDDCYNPEVPVTACLNTSNSSHPWSVAPGVEKLHPVKDSFLNK